MKKSVKRIMVVCILAILTLSIVGGLSIQAAKPKKVQLRFSWWGNDARHKATLKAIELYTKKNPHVEIMAEYGGFGTYYQKLLTQLAGRTAADIIQIDYKWVNDLASQGKLFVDMSKMSNKIDMSGFDKKFVKDQCAVGDYILGLPTGISVLGLIGNDSLLKEAGINIDQDWDWDKIIEEGVKLQKFDKNKHLLYMKTIHYYYLTKVMLKQKTGTDFINDDYTLAFTKKDLVDVFSYIRKMIDLGVVPPLEETVLFDGGDPDQNPNWLQGQYAFNSNQASKLAAIIGASKFDIDVARYPVPKNAKNPGLITSPAQILTINKNSDHIDEAAKFVNWFFNDPEAILTLRDTRGLPAVKKAREILMKENLLDERVVRMVDVTLPFSGGAENALSLNQEIETIVEDYIHQVGFKKLTPEKAADNMMKDLNYKLQELKSAK